MYQVKVYVTRERKNPFEIWYDRLRDSKARLAIRRRLNRVLLGNLSDTKFCQDGIWELRIDVGAGYRVYYALDGEWVILLLCGGDKDSQQTDIKRAAEFWRDWRRRADER